MHRDNWDDIRFVLAVADTGSVSAAARSLGVNHATVLRRIGAFEHRIGMVLFDRTPKGYAIPDDRAHIIEAAREVETSVLSVERLMKGSLAPLRGAVRITSTDTFCHAVLPRLLGDMARDAPDLQISLFCNNSHVDFTRLSADITVRPAARLSDDMFGEPAGHLGFSVYAAGDDVTGWLSLKGPLSRSSPAEWMNAELPADDLSFGADSFVVLAAMAAQGLGRTVLPCVLGDADPALVRFDDAMPRITVPIWVASHLDLADTPRIRATRDMLVQALRQERDRFLGA